jgi:hypothetical protein
MKSEYKIRNVNTRETTYMVPLEAPEQEARAWVSLQKGELILKWVLKLGFGLLGVSAWGCV